MPKTLISTTIALIGFAANSVICRLALEGRSIDASSFTAVRLSAGALTLVVILSVRSGSTLKLGKGRWTSAFMLFTYAATFSFAYHYLEAGLGALVLFAAVQTTMILYDYVKGNRLTQVEWGGLLFAFGGIVVLVLPGITAPPLLGVLLMTIAGCAWGFYTLMGKISKNNFSDTTGNFVKSLPFATVLLFTGIFNGHLSLYGVILAIISGGLTTGVIYVVWYVALDGLTIVQGAVVQLMVPLIAAFGGVLFLSETITARLVVSCLMIMGGILSVILLKKDNVKI